MKKWIDIFRAKQFYFLKWVMARDYQALYQASLKADVMSLSSSVAQKLYEHTLEKEGFVHCARCPQRFGLRRGNDGKYYCQRHAQQAPAVA